MPQRKEPVAHSAGKSALLVVLLIVACLAVMAYPFRDYWLPLATGRGPVDVARIDRAIDSVYSTLDPRDITTTEADLGGRIIRCDRVELPRRASLLRANLAITETVETAGGAVDFGVESTDHSRRRRTVVLGVSAGDSLIREITLETRVR